MKVAKKDAINAWWFSEGTTLPHGDGRKVEVGSSHYAKGRIVACNNGLHGSENPLDALKFAPGAIVWRTRHWGTVQQEDDKLCSMYREYVAGGVDASDTLRAFARWCALQVYEKIAKYDTGGTIKRWLETGDESIRSAALSAAESAAESAALSVWSAARSVWSAARSAALSAAESVWSAAESARSAVWSVWSAAESARSAAEYARSVWSAARDDQGAKLTEMLEALIAGK